MSKRKTIPGITPVQAPPKVFTGIKLRPVTLREPGTVDVTASLRRLRGQ
ncbi:MAG: hypothetical protein HC933_09230 [Pleurocapsa sp. SU_196_0]|nr:hypothetical protein [Pleurocapsa sp. SU_196_0]